MDKNHANHCIRCTINECANHCDCEPCCALESIEVCCCNTDRATDKQCTECASFRAKNEY